jgi:hypothetical protein
LAAPHIRVVEDIVVDECRGVNEFDDRGQIAVFVENPTRGASRQQGEGRSQSFAITLDGVGDIRLDRRVESPGLRADALLNLSERV